MKKRVLLLITSLCILMLLGGCKKDAKDQNNANDDNANTEDQTDTASGLDEYVEVPEKEDFTVSEFIKLGQYKGVEVSIEKKEVTDADIQEVIDLVLESIPSYEEITDRTEVMEGDIANIDYEGLKDGVAFEGGTSQGYDLKIGSGQFIPGFEDQLVGAKVGEKVELNLTFPEDYQSAELAGQAVVFKVTVNSIKKEVPSTLTEEFVKTNTGLDSIEAFKEDVRNYLEQQNEDAANYQIMNEVLTAIIKNSEITFPESLINYYTAIYQNDMIDQAASYNMKLTAYLEQDGKNEDTFNEDAKLYAEEMASQELVIWAVIDAEKMDLTEDEYNEGVSKLATDYGYPSKEEFLKIATEEDIRETLLIQKALEFIMDEAKTL